MGSKSSLSITNSVVNGQIKSIKGSSIVIKDSTVRGLGVEKQSGIIAIADTVVKKQIYISSSKLKSLKLTGVNEFYLNNNSKLIVKDVDIKNNFIIERSRMGLSFVTPR